MFFNVFSSLSICFTLDILSIIESASFFDGISFISGVSTGIFIVKVLSVIGEIQ
jgi:hypothetical protein